MVRNPKLVENLTYKELEDIQIKLLKRRIPLYIKDLDKKQLDNKSYYVGLKEIFYYNHNNPTLYSSSNRVQCSPLRNRSQGDLYMIMRYYYPDISFKDFRKALIALLNNYCISTFYCRDIQKRIFYTTSRNKKADFGNILGNLHEPDELGFTLSKFCDGTFKEHWFGSRYTNINSLSNNIDNNEDEDDDTYQCF